MNAHCVNIASRDKQYRRALNRADYLLPDGSGIAAAARLIGKRLVENLNGTDLSPKICEQAALNGQSVYFLGARPGIAKKTAQEMKRRYGSLQIAGTYHGYFSEGETAQICEKINRSGADILFVGMGVPRQELWVEQNKHRLNARLIFCVGGLFDYYSNRIPRAPLWMRKTGNEWIWRFYQEPTRMWRRYLIGNPIFLLRALKFAWKIRFPRTDAAARRAMDLLGGTILLSFFAPVIGFCALLVKLESRGPAFFSQTRIGENGQPFTMWKIRSMRPDAENLKAELKAKNQHGNEAITFKDKRDPRITRIGAFIRRFSIDELPQLWNVVTGDMSLVGPRPALPSEVIRYEKSARARLGAKGGLTCFWQIAGRADIPFDEQVRLDMDYIYQQSVWTDIKVLAKTPMAVISGKGAC